MTTGLLIFASVLLALESWRRHDGILFALAVFLLSHFTLRSAILAAGLDVPYPPYLFVATPTGAFHEADLVVTGWILCIVVISWLWRSDGATSVLTTVARRPIPTFPLIALTMASLLLLIAQHGGFGEVQRYVRLGDNGSGGTGIFLLAPSSLLVIALAQVRGYGAAVRNSSYIGLGTSVVAFIVLGSRTPVIALVIALGFGSVVKARSGSRFSLRALAIPVLLAIAIPLIAVTLRSQRDASLNQHLSANEVPTGTVSQVSRSINANYYDSLVLVARDVGVDYPHRPVSLFVTDVQALVPHTLWPDKPPFVSSGKWLRRQYEPARINGWPVGAPGDWYLALGAYGILIGSVLTVGASQVLRRQTARLSGSARVELAVCWGLLVLPGGVDEQFLDRLVVWVLAPLLYAALARPFSRETSTRPLAPRELETKGALR
jgi:hypothetical protein